MGHSQIETADGHAWHQSLPRTGFEAVPSNKSCNRYTSSTSEARQTGQPAQPWRASFAAAPLADVLAPCCCGCRCRYVGTRAARSAQSRPEALGVLSSKARVCTGAVITRQLKSLRHPGRCMRLRREWMGVEPTRAASAAPLNDFEDRGAHRDSTTPVRSQTTPLAWPCQPAPLARYLLGLTFRSTMTYNGCVPLARGDSRLSIVSAQALAPVRYGPHCSKRSA